MTDSAYIIRTLFYFLAKLWNANVNIKFWNFSGLSSYCLLISFCVDVFLSFCNPYCDTFFYYVQQFCLTIVFFWETSICSYFSLRFLRHCFFFDVSISLYFLAQVSRSSSLLYPLNCNATFSLLAPSVNNGHCIYCRCLSFFA